MREFTFTMSAILCFVLQREMDIPFLGRAAAQYTLRPGYLAPTGPALAEPQGRSFDGKQRQTLSGDGVADLYLSTANPSTDWSEFALPARPQRSMECGLWRTAFFGLSTGQSLCRNTGSHHRMATAPGGHLLSKINQRNLGAESQSRAAVFPTRRGHLLRTSNPIPPRVPLSLSLVKAKATIACKRRAHVAICRTTSFWPFRSGAPPPHPTRTHQTLRARNRLYVLVSAIRKTLRIPQSPHRAYWPNFKTLKP